MWISWKHQDTDLSWPLAFEQKVDLFYEQTLGWQLHIADLVANGGVAFGEEGKREGKTVSSIRHSGFAVLQICLSYFETIGDYTGKRSGSKDAFRAGVLEVFPEVAGLDPAIANDAIDALYEGVRCGLYHNIRTTRVRLGQPPDKEAIAYDLTSRYIIISPERFPSELKAHLERFRSKLLNPSNKELRARFEERFDQDSGCSGAKHS